jgi:hypothetical protein
MSQLKFPVMSIPELATLLDMSVSNLRSLANTTEKNYTYWKELKSSGGFRDLSAPKPQLKVIQKKLHNLIFSRVLFGRFSHYGIKRKSNITNASEHYGSGVVFTFDLKSFFPSVRPERVKGALIEEIGCPASLASLITKLVTVNFQLPQGAPTSTDIANIVTLRLQRRLYPLAQQWGVKKFTIYADDITFSGDNIHRGFEQMVKKIVREEGLKIHPDKGGTFNKSRCQIITGLNIAHGLTVGKLKTNWRAERHRNKKRFINGEITEKEFEVSEKRYHGRLIYSNSVKRVPRKSAIR